MNFNEDGPSYFCHVRLKSEPTKPFLKYTTTKNSEPEFIDHTGEHGYSYIKIIKLKEAHPLVELATRQKKVLLFLLMIIVIKHQN